MKYKNEIFNQLISPKNASEKTGLEESTIRKAIKNKILIEGEDCIKIGKQWVIFIPSLKKLDVIKKR